MTTNEATKDCLHLPDRLKLIVELDKLKHTHFWNLLYYSVGAFAAILMVPLFKRAEFSYKPYLYVFPGIALFVVLISHWAMMAEYKRFRMYRDIVQTEILGGPNQTPFSSFGLYKYPIGKVISISWLVAGITLSSFALIALYLG